MNNSIFSGLLDPSLPSHKWKIERKVTKSGPKTGKVKYFTSLIVPPYVFKRKEDKKVNCIATFTCNLCEHLTPTVSTRAKAIKVSEDMDGKPEYMLKTCPTVKDHQCLPSSTYDLSQSFYPRCYEKIEDDPERSIGSIYKEVKTELYDQVTDLQRITLVDEIPSLQDCNGNLYKFRNQFFPPPPNTPVSSI